MATTGESMAGRLRLLIEQWGQPVRVRRGSGAWETVTARIVPMSNTVKFAWFRSTETASWAAPAFVVTLPEGGQAGSLGVVQTGDTVELPQGVYTVRKIDRPRLAGVIIKTTLLVARDA